MVADQRVSSFREACSWLGLGAEVVGETVLGAGVLVLVCWCAGGLVLACWCGGGLGGWCADGASFVGAPTKHSCCAFDALCPSSVPVLFGSSQCYMYLQKHEESCRSEKNPFGLAPEAQH